MAEENAAPGADKAQPTFVTRKVYIKDASFESPNAPAIFEEQWSGKLELHIGVSHKAMGNDNYEVVLTVTTSSKKDDTTAFLCEVHQSGIFQIAGFDEQQLTHMLAVYCPGTLFPYAREAVGDLISKGGFPQVLLTPINFEALFMQKQQQAQAAQADQAH